MVNRKIASVKSHLRESIKALKLFGEESANENAVISLASLYADIEGLRKSASGSVERIRELFSHPSTVQLAPTARSLSLAAERGLQGKAPFVAKGKNCIADAVIIEIFREEVAKASSSRIYGFVTTDFSDFCDNKDKRNPHPDLAELFDAPNVFFETNVAQALNTVQDSVLPPESVKRVTEFSEQFTTDTCPNCGFCPLVSIGKRPSVFGEYWSLFLQCPKCSFRVDTGAL